jgi:hypothetical protein
VASKPFFYLSPFVQRENQYKQHSETDGIALQGNYKKISQESSHRIKQNM